MVNKVEADAHRAYEDLSPEVRRFLERLDEDDLQALADGIKVAQSRKILIKAVKWSLLAIFTAFTTMAALGQSIEWLWNRWKG